MISYEQWCEANRDVRPLVKRLKSSLPEQYLGFYLSQRISLPIEYAKGFEWLGHGSIDIYFPTLRLAIEYDGVYYHRNKYADDCYKSKLCKANGISVIRIRENSLEKSGFRNDIVIPYVAKKQYSNIDKLIEEVIAKINERYKLDFEADVDIKRDNDRIIRYIQDKYYRKSMAYIWPEVFDYWDNRIDVTPYDLFYTDDAPFVCPHCGSAVSHYARYHHNQKSLVPCECEKREIEKTLKRVKREYREKGLLVTFDNTLSSRRLYDRMMSDVRYFLHQEEDTVICDMYRKLGFDVPDWIDRFIERKES